jgi:GT2 family glycosyltransferase
VLGAGHRAEDYHTSNTEPALLTVIILARNQSMLTRACLDALACVPADLDVRLVDNASRDDTPALAREYAARFRRFTYRRSPRNLGFALANNRAAREPSGEALLFLNNDVQVSPGAVSRLLDGVIDGGGGIAGPKLLYPDATIQHAGIRQMLWGYASNRGTRAPREEPALDRGRSIFAVTGAMLAVGSDVFQRVGGFDERYRWGYEDVDLCLKVHRAGADVRYVPDAESVHAESATLATVRRPPDLAWNYALYRRRWNHRLVPAEHAAIDRLRRAGVRRVAVFGTGLAAAGLHRMLRRRGIAVIGFTASTVGATRFRGLPVAPLTDLHRWRYDRLLVASQHYYAVRTRLRELDPAGRPMLPLADVGDGDHDAGW